MRHNLKKNIKIQYVETKNFYPRYETTILVNKNINKQFYLYFKSNCLLVSFNKEVNLI